MKNHESQPYIMKNKKTMKIPRKIMKTNHKYWKTIKNIVNIVNTCWVQIITSVARVSCKPFFCAYFFLYKTSGSDVLVKLIASCMIGYHWSFMIGLNHCSLMYNIKEALLKEKFTVRCSSVTTRHDTTATLCTQGLDFVNATGVVRYSKANFHHLCLRNVPDCQKFPFRSPLRFTLVQTRC